MKSNYLVNLVLVLLIIVLFWLNNQENTDKHAVETISTLSAEDVTTIAIFKDNKLSSEFAISGEKWHMTSPLAVRANKTRIEVLLSLLALPISSSMDITPQTDLTQFGIDQHSPRLRLNGLDFQFGSVDLISERRYVMHQQKLYLLNDRVAPLLNTGSHSFIDNRLFSKEQKLNYLYLPSIDDSGNVIPTYNELKLINGHWQSNNNHGPEQLQKLVDSWQYAQALQVVPLVKLGLDKRKALTIKIGTTQSKTESDDYLLYISNNAVFLINDKHNLAYQFVLDIQQQLFLKAP